jgi:hypothetical protein
MERSIRVITEDISVTGELNDSSTAAAILEALPIEASGSRWSERMSIGPPLYATKRVV